MQQCSEPVKSYDGWTRQSSAREKPFPRFARNSTPQDYGTHPGFARFWYPPVLRGIRYPGSAREYGTPVLQDYGTPGSARSRYPWFCVITVPLVVYGTSPTHSPLAGGSPLTNDTARQPGYGAVSCPRRHAHAPRVVWRRLSRITVVDQMTYGSQPKV